MTLNRRKSKQAEDGGVKGIKGGDVNDAEAKQLDLTDVDFYFDKKLD